MDTEQKETDILKRKNKDLQFCLDKEVSNVMNLTSELQSTKQQHDELLASAQDAINTGDMWALEKAIAKAVSNG